MNKLYKGKKWKNPDKCDANWKMPLTNQEIFDMILKSGLLDDCLTHQLKNVKEGELTEDDKDDFIQEMCLILLEYNNDKLNDAYLNNHLNALITAIIRMQLISNNCKTYYTYRQWNNNRQTFKLKEYEEETYD